MSDNFFDERRLPEFCYAFNPAINNGTIIKRDESGYYAVDFDCTPEVCRMKNDTMKITPEQVQAMIMGSMMGWKVPGASVESWEQKTAGGLDVDKLTYER